MNAVIVLILRILLIVLSYLFIGWIGFIVYQDLRRNLSGFSKHKVPVITLSAVLDQENLNKQYDRAEIIIGRDPACDFTLDDPTISLRHCQLTYHHKQWWAKDLGSTNGTLLNQAQIENAVVITDGDELSVGRVTIIIEKN
jgi:hypothetical protein